MVADWLNGLQQRVIEYLVKNSRSLREQLDILAKGTRILSFQSILNRFRAL